MPLNTEGNASGIVSGRIFCPIHHCITLAGECDHCKSWGLVVIDCEPDKISRTVDTMESQGFILSRPVRAIAVFETRKDA